MSRREVTDCDRCGKETASPMTVRLPVGWSPDAAGGPSTRDCERVDLCPACAAWGFGKIADKVGEDECASFVKLVRTEKARLSRTVAVVLLVVFAPIGARAGHLTEIGGERAVVFGGRTWTWEHLADKRAEAPGRFDANHPVLGWVLSHPDAATARRDLNPERFDRFHPYLGWLLGGLRPGVPEPPPVAPPVVSPPIHIVPEPSGLILAATGLLGLLAAIRRNRP